MSLPRKFYNQYQTHSLLRKPINKPSYITKMRQKRRMARLLKIKLLPLHVARRKEVLLCCHREGLVEVTLYVRPSSVEDAVLPRWRGSRHGEYADGVGSQCSDGLDDVLFIVVVVECL